MISDEQIEHLVYLATRDPTSFNLQNSRFLAMRTPERKAKLRKLAYDQAKVSEAAVTFMYADSSRTIPLWKGVSRPQRLRASCRPSLSLDG
jgi:nitroreductase